MSSTKAPVEPLVNAGESPLSSWLRTAQERARISLEGMAKRAGISVSALSRLRDGTTEPRLRTLHRLVATFGDDSVEAERVRAWAERRAAERAADFRPSRAAPRARG